ncbi:MAG: hypothetical protein KKE61_03325 [Proteobacteria bacterium]|nr:hypothetical protein [Pseudomonadota bacterium]
MIKGFPKRVAHLKGITATASQINALNREFFNPQETKGYDFTHDPRICCLLELIKHKNKLLVICSTKEKVAAIEKAIATHLSIDVAKFDETMTLLQRDRNAVWFSKETGARILICSEIGSEGRNFQFVHHLFLFDLPRNPELLEQRIGRVDRIGQKNTIQIHVPFVLGSAYEILARWYMDGLNLFNKNRNGVHLIFKEFEPLLADLFRQSKAGTAVEESLLDKLILQTKSFCIKVDKQLDQGKNILLEMNSFKPESAKKIIRHIVQTETKKDLDALLIPILDHYGIETNFFDTTEFTLNSTGLTDEKFPVPANLSKAMTFNRKTAIVRDDIDFFSWDHPFVLNTFEYFITTNAGSCASAVLKGQNHPGIWLETVFILECVAPLHLNLERYLIPDPIRIVVDHEGTDITLKKPVSALSKTVVQDQSHWFMDIEELRQVLIPSMIEKSVSIAGMHSEVMIKKGKTRIKKILGKEVTRLIELKKINPDIRKEEIQLAQTRMTSALDHLSTARLRMDALRLIRVQ